MPLSYLVPTKTPGNYSPPDEDEFRPCEETEYKVATIGLALTLKKMSFETAPSDLKSLTQSQCSWTNRNYDWFKFDFVKHDPIKGDLNCSVYIVGSYLSLLAAGKGTLENPEFSFNEQFTALANDRMGKCEAPVVPAQIIEETKINDEAVVKQSPVEEIAEDSDLGVWKKHEIRLSAPTTRTSQHVRTEPDFDYDFELPSFSQKNTYRAPNVVKVWGEEDETPASYEPEPIFTIPRSSIVQEWNGQEHNEVTPYQYHDVALPRPIFSLKSGSQANHRIPAIHSYNEPRSILVNKRSGIFSDLSDAIDNPFAEHFAAIDASKEKESHSPAQADQKIAQVEELTIQEPEKEVKVEEVLTFGPAQFNIPKHNQVTIQTASEREEPATVIEEETVYASASASRESRKSAILGGWNACATDSKIVRDAFIEARHQGKIRTVPLTTQNVKSCARQVVAGWNYRISFSFNERPCYLYFYVGIDNKMEFNDQNDLIDGVQSCVQMFKAK